MKLFLSYIASLFYLIAIKLYSKLYDYKILKPFKLNDSPIIISIGNITIGGSGKTPMIICVSEILTNAQIKHAIISRGYKKKKKGMIVVSDGKINNSNSSPTADECGDEPYLLATKLPDVPIVVDENKKNALEYANSYFKPKVVLIDDGFQSLYLNIDYHIVLHSATSKKQDMRLLPVGRLRQPISSLNRANQIIITKSNTKQNTLLDVEKLHCRVSYSKYKNSMLHWQKNKNSFTTINIENANLSSFVFVFCGIADSSLFFNSISKYYKNIILQKEYADHYDYSENPKFNLDCKVAISKGAQIFITTYKDFVKIKSNPKFMNLNVDWYILDIEYSINNSAKAEILNYVNNY